MNDVEGRKSRQRESERIREWRGLLGDLRIYPRANIPHGPESGDNFESPAFGAIGPTPF